MAAIERVADSWRTNVARGGQARPVSLTAGQEALCLQAAQALQVDYAGVDLLPASNGDLYLIEVNSVPGWQGLQSVTPTNIAEELVSYLEAEHNRQPARNGRPAQFLGALDL